MGYEWGDSSRIEAVSVSERLTTRRSIGGTLRSPKSLFVIGTEQLEIDRPTDTLQRGRPSWKARPTDRQCRRTPSDRSLPTSSKSTRYNSILSYRVFWRPPSDRSAEISHGSAGMPNPWSRLKPKEQIRRACCHALGTSLSFRASSVNRTDPQNNIVIWYHLLRLTLPMKSSRRTIVNPVLPVPFCSLFSSDLYSNV